MTSTAPRHRVGLGSVVRLLEHNDNHYITLPVGPREAYLCTRCTGMWAGLLIGLPPAVALNLLGLPGPITAALGVLLFLPDFTYWALTRVRLLPDLTQVRVTNGLLLGLGIACYGQASLAWDLKLAVPLLLFALVIVAHPILGRRDLTHGRSAFPTRQQTTSRGDDSRDRGS